MEMESSRRSAVDRPRETGPIKKARLAQGADRDRTSNGAVASRDRPVPPLLPRVPAAAASGAQPSASRFRGNDRGDSARGGGGGGGGGSSHRQQQQQQELQELVAQYKMALSELTFNSKPIITNLTIIAGENLHAAKVITATICANILEVPSEQKLPSLYLLDSIAKNIGSDYIKYFAARLPEVFCKAYREVDSSTLSSMRHLFQTWKGVFPSAPLNLIEKELAFPTSTNGSTGAAVSRPDSQRRGPPQSIHVNPKYLEARQHIQQSTTAREMSNGDVSTAVDPDDDAARPEGTSFIAGARLSAEFPAKKANMQHPQREQLGMPVSEKRGYGDHKFSSDFARQSNFGLSVKERGLLDKPWYGAGGAAVATPAGRVNGFDANNAYEDYKGVGSARADHLLSSVHMKNLSKGSQLQSENWKNSEEEEYVWDDVSSKSANQDGAIGKIKDGWSASDAGKPAGLQRGKPMLPEGRHMDSPWSDLENSRLVTASIGEDEVRETKEFDEHLPRYIGMQDSAQRIKMETFTNSPSTGRAALTHQSLVWPSREPSPSMTDLNQMGSRDLGRIERGSTTFMDKLSTVASSSVARSGLSGFQSHAGLSGNVPSSSGTLSNIHQGFGQSRQQQLRPPSPSAHIPLTSAHQKSLDTSNNSHRQHPSFPQTSQKNQLLPGQLNRVHLPAAQDSYSFFPQNNNQRENSQHSNAFQNLQSSLSQSSQQLQYSSASSVPSIQSRNHFPLLHQSYSDLSIKPTQQESQLPAQMQKQQPLSLSFGTNQVEGTSGTSHSDNTPVDLSGQSEASNLLDVVMKSGLLSNSSASSIKNLTVQPPLPNGPPPGQGLTSSVPMATLSSSVPVSCSNAPSVIPPRAVLPPLPPGPPPPSSLVVTSSQTPSAVGANPKSLSSLLSSLVAKGLISTPVAETSASVKIPSLPSQSSGFASNSSMLVPSSSDSPTVNSLSSMKELSVPEPSAQTRASIPQPSTAELKCLIGIDFKADVIREFHSSVIDGLFNDLKHECHICGLRFKLLDQLRFHLDRHALEKSGVDSAIKSSRKWYACLSDWVDGYVELSSGPLTVSSLEDTISDVELSEPMVPADESQSICALCGDPFEDFYSIKRDEWMYKGAVYLDLLDKRVVTGSMDRTGEQTIIVHAKCN